MKSVTIVDNAIDKADGQLSFKILLSQTSENGYTDSSEMWRSYTQLQWFHNKLHERYPNILIPPFPDKPATVDNDYVEKKRLQMERYLNKIFSRRELDEDKDVAYFLNGEMAILNTRTSEASKSAFSPFGFLNFLSKSDVYLGFKVFVPPSQIAGVDDTEEFANRKKYILVTEQHLTGVLDLVGTAIRNKEAFAKTLHQVGMSFKENLDLGTKIPAGVDHESFHAILTGFYDFCGKMKAITALEVREDVWYFGDVILEYKNTVDCLKRVMNHRTDMLVDYVDAIKSRGKVYEKLLKAQSLALGKTSEISQVEQDLKVAEQTITTTRKLFDETKITLTREMIRFEREKVRDIRNALKDYAKTQIRYEKQKLKAAEILLQEWS